MFRAWRRHLELALFPSCLWALGTQPRVWLPKKLCHEPALSPSLWKNEFQSHISTAHLCPCPCLGLPALPCLVFQWEKLFPGLPPASLWPVARQGKARQEEEDDFLPFHGSFSLKQGCESWEHPTPAKTCQIKGQSQARPPKMKTRGESRRSQEPRLDFHAVTPAGSTDWGTRREGGC